MNDKQRAEIGFWDQLIARLGRDGFLAQRKQDFFDNSSHYQGQYMPVGDGLEVGSGLYSQLEWSSGTHVVAVDPLMDEYIKLIEKYGLVQAFVTLVPTFDENLPFPDESFDWAVCWNVIDHTPNPQLLVDEIWRVMKPGSQLYFEVHFDDHLGSPHYGLWREDTIKQHFSSEKWSQTFINKFRNPDYPQEKYYAIFEKKGDDVKND